MAERPRQLDPSSRLGTTLAIPALLVSLQLLSPPVPSVAGELLSGREEGETVPEFHARVVTGPLRNRSVCFVCRHGSRPVVMIFVRDTAPEVQRLMRNVDRIVDRHRLGGLRSFGVWLSAEPSQADVSRLQTFAFDGRVRMPLVVAPDDTSARDRQNVHGEAAVTVVCYRDRRVVERMALRSDELDVPNLQRVLKRVLRFAEAAGVADAASVGPHRGHEHIGRWQRPPRATGEEAGRT